MACARSCSGSAGAGCSRCGGTCSGSCTGCSGSCSGSCTGCSGSCSGSCFGSCSGSCQGNCTRTCADNCSGKCNTKCTGGASANVANLTLVDIYTQSNIKAISDAIYYEAGPNRRNKSPTSVTFSVGEVITSEKMETVINNLIKAGQSITASDYSVADGNIVLKTFGNALISKVKTAYAQTIKG